jgi:DNA mismatch repair protein MSH6
MSKVKSAVGSNQKTLLSFFNKSTSTTPITLPNNSTPRDDKCISHTPVATITSARSDITTGATSCSPDEFSAVVTNKRRRVLAVDDDEEEVEREVNVKPTKRSVMSTPMSDNEEWSEEGLEDSDDEEEDLGGTLGNANKKLRANIPRPPRPLISQNESQKVVIKREIDSCLMSPHTYTPVSAVVRKELTSSNSPEEEDRRMLPDGVSAMGSHEHHAWPFLKPANRKDKSGRGPTDPLYNARTLHVPVKFLNDLTPAMQQWMDFKMDNMDTVLFFKVGKFYELYHMDADVGVGNIYDVVMSE